MRNFLILLLIVSSPVLSAIAERPSKTYTKQAINNYEWMIKNNKSLLIVRINDHAKRYTSASEISRYTKLKMRNFVNDLKIIDKSEDYNHSYLYIDIEIHKYNDTTKINYGLISFRMYSAVSWNTGEPLTYMFTMPIAGSDEQINSSIKKDIDTMIEIFAEDYYFLSDIQQ